MNIDGITVVNTVLYQTRGQKKIFDVHKRLTAANNKLIKQLKEPGVILDKTALKAATAYTKQLGAVQRVGDGVTRLTQRAKKIGGLGPVIGALTRGFKKYATTLESGVLTTQELTAANTEMQAVLNRTTEKIKKYQDQTTAMTKQLNAAAAAERKVALDNQKILSTGGPQRFVDNNIAALKKYKALLSGGVLSSEQMARATRDFDKALSRTKTSLKGITEEQRRNKNTKFNKVMRNLESSSVLAFGPLSRVGARIRSIGSITSRSTLKLAAFFAVITGGIVGMTLLFRSSVKAARELEQIRAGFVAATGSMQAANRELMFVIKTSQDFGIGIKEAALQFSQFEAAARRSTLTTREIRTTFKGVAAAGSALKLSAADVGGAMRALQQMMSKGTVQAEELRGQFGERIPGALQLAAKAMGVTTTVLNRRLALGLVKADDLVRKLGPLLVQVFGSQAQRSAMQYQGVVNNLANAWLLFNKRVSDYFHTSDAAKSQISALTAVINALKDNLDGIVSSLEGVAAGFVGLALASLIANWGAVTSAVAAATAGVKLFNIAVAATPVGAIVKLGLLLGTAALGYVVLGNKAVKAGNAQDQFANKISNLIDLGKKSGGIGQRALADAFDEAGKRYGVVAGKLLVARKQFDALNKKATNIQKNPGNISIPERQALKENLKAAGTRVGVLRAQLERLKEVLHDLGGANAIIDDAVNQRKLPNQIKLVHGIAVAYEAAKTAMGKIPEGVAAVNRALGAAKIAVKLDGISKPNRLKLLEMLKDQFKGLVHEGDTLGTVLARLEDKTTAAGKATRKFLREAVTAPAAVKGIREKIDLLNAQAAALEHAAGSKKPIEAAKAAKAEQARLKARTAAIQSLRAKGVDPKEAVRLADAQAAANERLARATQKLADAKAAERKQISDQKAAKALKKRLDDALQLQDVEVAGLHAKAAAFRSGNALAKQQSEAEVRINNVIAARTVKLHNLGLADAEVAKRMADLRAGLEDLAAGQELFNKKLAQQKAIEQTVTQSFNRIGDAITEAFVQGNGAAISFKSVMLGVIAEVERAIIKAAFIKPLIGQFADKAKNASGTGILGLIGGFLPKFASGGTPTVGKMSVVGERGPELFVPKTAGQIIPNGALGNNVQVTVNVAANGQQSVATNTGTPRLAELGTALGSAVRAEIMNQMRPGGILETVR